MQPNDPLAFDAFADTHPIGTVVTGSVEDVREFGAFCQLAEGVQGLLMVVDFGDPPKRFEYPGDYPRVGDFITATIVRIDRSQLLLRLSRRSGAAE